MERQSETKIHDEIKLISRFGLKILHNLRTLYPEAFTYPGVLSFIPSDSKVHAEYLKWLDYFRSKFELKAHANTNTIDHIYFVDSKCPVCDFPINAVNAGLVIDENHTENKLIPVQCPIGHKLNFNAKQGELSVREIDSYADIRLEDARRNKRLSTI